MAFCYYCMNNRVEEGASRCPVCEREIPLVLRGDEVVPRALRPGTVLKNRYILGRPLGAGGFAVTYLAWDKELFIVRAVKEFFPMNNYYRDGEGNVRCVNPHLSDVAEALRRFNQEAQIMAQVSSRHVPRTPQVMDRFDANGTNYIVMEYLSGRSLKDRLDDEHRLSFEETVKVGLDVLETMQKLHEENLLHRDISAANIIQHSHDGRYWLIDYGNSGWIDQQESFPHNFTEGYSSYEQHKSLPQGPYSDVYSLAVTLFRCAVGGKPNVYKPYNGVGRRQLDESKIGRPLPVASANAPEAGIPQWFDDLLIHATMFEPAQRIQTAEEFRQVLLAHSKGLRSSGSSGAGGVKPKLMIIAGVAVLLVGGAIFLLTGLGGDKEDPAEPTATPSQAVVTTYIPAEEPSPSFSAEPVTKEPTPTPAPVTAAPVTEPFPDNSPTATPKADVTKQASFSNIRFDSAVLEPLLTGYLNGSASLVITGYATPNERLVLSINEINVDWFRADAQGRFSTTMDSSLLSTTGWNAVTIRYENPAAKDTTYAHCTFQYKPSIAPVVLNVQPQEGALSFSGVAEPYAMVYMEVDGRQLAELRASSTGAFLLSTEGLTAGMEITITAKDAAGNTTSCTATVLAAATYTPAPVTFTPAPATSTPTEKPTATPVVYTVIQVDPAFTDLINSRDYIQTRQSYTLSGTALPGQTLELRVTGKLIARLTADNEGRFTATVDAADLTPDSENQISIIYADSPDKTATEAYIPFLYKPEMADTTLDKEPRARMTELSGTADPGAELALYIDDALIARTTAGTDGRFRFQSLTLEMDQQLRIEAADAADHTTTLRASVLDREHFYSYIEVDTGFTVLINANGYLKQEDVYYISGKASPEEELVLTINDAVVVSGFSSDESGAFTAELPAGLIPEQRNINLRVNYAAMAELNLNTFVKGFAFHKKTTMQPTILSVQPQEGEESFSGTAEPNAQVTLYSGSMVLGITTSDEQGRFTLPMTRLEEGMRITITAKDDAGNTASVTTSVLAPEVVYTAIRIDESFNNQLNSNGYLRAGQDYTLTGTAAPNQALTLFVNGSAAAQVTADDKGAFAATVKESSLKEGASNTLKLAYVSKDAPQGLEAATTVLYDATIADILLDDVLRGKQDAITGTAEPNAQILLYINNRQIAQTTASARGSFAFTGLNLIQGQKVVLRAVDAAENTVTTSASVEAPVVVYTGIQISEDIYALMNGNGYLRAGKDHTLTGTATPEQPLTLFINGSAAAQFTADEKGAFSVTVKESKLAANAFNDVMVAYVSKNAPEGLEASVSFLYDPTIAVTTLSDVLRGKQDTITGTAEPRALLTLYINGSRITTTTASANGSFTFSGLSLVQGQMVTIRAEDIASNINEEVWSVIEPLKVYNPIQLDPAILSRIHNGYLRAAKEHVITGTGTPNELLNLIVNDKVVIKNIRCDEQGEFSVTLPQSKLPDNAMVTILVDYAELEDSTFGSGLTFAYKSGMAATKLTVQPQENEAAFGGTAEPNAAITLSRGGMVLATTTAGANGRFSLPADGLTQGMSVTVTAEDAAGNTSAVIATVLAPKIIYTPIQASLEGLNANGTIPADLSCVFNGSGTPLCEVRLLLNGSELFTFTTGEDGWFSVGIDYNLIPFDQTSTVRLEYVAEEAKEFGSTAAQIAFTRPTPVGQPVVSSILRAGVTAISGKTDSGATLTLYINDRKQATATGTRNGTYAFNNLTLNKGDRILVEAVDKAGNTAATRATVGESVEFEVLSHTSLTGGKLSTTAKTTFDLSGTAQSGMDFEVKLDGRVTNQAKLGGTAGEMGGWSASVDLSSLASGTVHTITAGYVGKTPVFTITFTVDNACDPVTVSTALNGLTRVIKGKTERNAEVTLYTDVTNYTTRAQGDGSFTFSLSDPLPEDAYIRLVAKDDMGNRSDELKLYVDLYQREKITMSSLPALFGPGKLPITISGTATPGEPIILQLKSGSTVSNITRVIPDANGKWSFTLRSSALVGNSVSSLIATYANSKLGYAAVTSSPFTFDPSCDTFSWLSTTSFDTDATTLSAMTERGATVRLLIDGWVVNTVTANSEGRFTMDLTGYLTAGCTLQLEAEDAAGNKAHTAKYAVTQAPEKAYGEIERLEAKERASNAQITYNVWAIGASDMNVSLVIVNEQGRIVTTLESEALSEKNLTKYSSENPNVYAEKGWEFRGRYVLNDLSPANYYVRLIGERNGESFYLAEDTFSIGEPNAKDDEAPSFDYLSPNMDFAVGLDEGLLSQRQPPESVILTGWLYAPNGSNVTYYYIIDGKEYNANAMRELGGVPKVTTLSRTNTPTSAIDTLITMYSNINAQRAGRVIQMNLSELTEGRHTVTIKQVIRMGNTSASFTRYTPEFTLILDSSAPALNINSLTANWK